jgi:hypothetical protein
MMLPNAGTASAERITGFCSSSMSLANVMQKVRNIQMRNMANMICFLFELRQEIIERASWL